MNSFFESFNLFLESSDEETFIKGIFDNPLDMTQLKVYADWLDDRDDPFSNVIRAALASATPENQHAGKSEPFYNVVKNMYQEGDVVINWSHGEIDYKTPKGTKSISVLPNGHITHYVDHPGVYHSTSIDKLKSLDLKRATLMLLLEELVNSHRTEHPHDPGFEYQLDRSKHIYPDPAMTWATRALDSLERQMWSFAGTSPDLGLWDEDECEMEFQNLIKQYLIPFEKMTREITIPGDWKHFAELQHYVMNVVLAFNLNYINKDLVSEFMRLTEKIRFRMINHK